MNAEEQPPINQCFIEAIEKYDELLELAIEAEAKKTLSNLKYLNTSLIKLNEYSNEFPPTFQNRTIYILARKLLKLFPLIIFDIGSDCPRKHMKWYSQWCGRVAELMSLEIDPPRSSQRN